MMYQGRPGMQKLDRSPLYKEGGETGKGAKHDNARTSGKVEAPLIIPPPVEDAEALGEMGPVLTPLNVGTADEARLKGDTEVSASFEKALPAQNRLY
jgi:hypothetical protein